MWCVGLRVKASQAYFDFLMISSSGIFNMVGELVSFKWTGLGSPLSYSLKEKTQRMLVVKETWGEGYDDHIQKQHLHELSW